MFSPGDTTWTMDNNLLNMGYHNLQLNIKLPDNSDVNVIISPPYQANAVFGMYICTFWLLWYYMYIGIQLLETLKPNITLQDYTPYKVAVNGDAVVLMCLAHGRSTITYQWEHHINESERWTAVSAVMMNGSLILSIVTEDIEGIYRCVACDCYSCSYSINTTITVIGKEINFINVATLCV